MTRVIAAICVWNEEQFIRNCIENIMQKIKNIYAIEILDGAWLPYASDNPNSTDNTKAIVLELKEKYKHLCNIFWNEPIAKPFESESAKRNTQLETIEKNYQDYAVFVIDADETIQAATGQQHFELASYIEDPQRIGCVKAFAFGSKIHGWTPRLFRGSAKIHYHTKRTMEVHGTNCKPRIAYDPESQPMIQDLFYHPTVVEITDFFLVNQYVKRDIDRRLAKLNSRKHEASLTVSACDYK